VIDRLRRSNAPVSKNPELVGPIESPTSVGIVHVGLGAFARAHQAIYTERAARITGDGSWGILAATGRRPDVAEALAPQGGLYGVLVRSQHGVCLQLVGSVVDAVSASETERVVAAIAVPATRIVTMTITEKAYSASPLSTPLALLCAGLLRRFQTSRAPMTVMSCDNLVGNGRVLRSIVTDQAGAGPFADWLASSVRFPTSMVDRIVPAACEEDRRIARGISGRADAGLVVAEPFMQWVIEDDFAAGRPRWDLAGAVFTNDVAPYEAAKLRLLNGTHSLLAYAGELAGHRTIAETVSDADIRVWARLLQRDARATLAVPDGVDLEAYSEQILDRFANPALRHTTRQVAMDGSQKLSARIVGTVVDMLETGRQPLGAAFAIAAWIAYVARTISDDLVQLDDPMAPRLREIVASTGGDAEALARSFLALEPIFPASVAGNDAFVGSVIDQTHRLMTTNSGAGR
jgi:fructuronate reductase